jgi:hypothetical protein
MLRYRSERTDWPPVAFDLTVTASAGRLLWHAGQAHRFEWTVVRARRPDDDRLKRHRTRAVAKEPDRRPKGVTGMFASKRSVATVTAVLGALALAAPIANAGATTTPTPVTWPGFSWTGSFSLPGLFQVPLTIVIPPITGTAVSKGPTVVNSVFNGATVVQVANGATANSIVASP